LRADRRPMWWFAVEVARRMGIRLLPDEVDANPSDLAILEQMIISNPRVPLAEMIANPGGKLVEVDRGPWFTEHAMPTQRWNLAPQPSLDSFRDIPRPPDGLVLVSRRQRYHMNTVHRDLDQGHDNESAIFLNPDDARERGLSDGDLATVRSEFGSLRLVV